MKMKVERVFNVSNKGTVLAGIVNEGTIKVGDTVFVLLEDGSEKQLTVRMIEVFGNDTIKEASSGTKVGIAFEETVSKNEMETAKKIIKE